MLLAIMCIIGDHVCLQVLVLLVIICAYRSSSIIGDHVCLQGVPVLLVIMCAYRSSSIVGDHVCLQEFQYCW